ncbi:RNA-binding protein S1 [Facklamia sp. DSM 111018]|uniref:RNA-binding protein S1 n=1 Tax=Facklamia lactis TaxID=2749967 RepID=A0ABS0LR28_9LACT|nr:S1 domain-containing RNA-binding protein [Facklamia lactis]MBG9980673.1 RNA-binding protein S1 [Facklamia lactis]MBG9986487.1 RNA-binding protein S1 [Facklamia lactis]
MAVEVGQKVTGKITGIKHFGAFVALEDNQSGLVHISEISDDFINDINDVLTVGDEVTVKVMSIADDGKISLSLRKANDEAKKTPSSKPSKMDHVKRDSNPSKPRNFHNENPTVPHGKDNYQKSTPHPNQNVTGKYAQRSNDDFDQLMSNFLKDSEDRLSSLKRNTEGKRGGRGGRRS